MKCFSVVLLVVANLVVSGVNFVDNAPNTEQTMRVSGEISNTESINLELEAEGHYNKKGFGDSYYIYRFENTDIVVYHFSDSIYFAGKDAEKEGESYGNIFINDSQFLALSNHYMLFLTSEGKIAILFEEEEYTKEDGTKMKKNVSIPFDQLPEEEKAVLVYPISYEKVVQ